MKKYLTYIGGFLGILIAGGLIWWGIREYQYRKSPDYQVMKYYNDLADQYAKDTYGGDTPEETLQLFIDALKKGDVELASKYFVPEKQEEFLGKFNIAKTNGNLNLYIKEVQDAKLGRAISSDNYLYTVVGDNDVAKYVISVIQNSVTKKWKIESL